MKSTTGIAKCKTKVISKVVRRYQRKKKTPRREPSANDPGGKGDLAKKITMWD